MQATLLAKISIRIVAIYLVAQGVLQSTSISSVFLNSLSADVTLAKISLLYIVMILFPLLFGLALWLVADKLAALIVGKAGGEALSVPVKSHQLQSVALGTVGLVMMFTALPSFLQQLIYIYSNTNVIDDVRAFNPGMLAQLVGTSLNLLSGLLLVLGARFWSSLLHKVKGFGLSEKRS